MPEEIKLKGWVARDKGDTSNIGLDLCLFDSKPKRDELGDYWFVDCNGSSGGYIILPTQLFPEVAWETEPMEIELTIKKVE